MIYNEKRGDREIKRGEVDEKERERDEVYIYTPLVPKCKEK